jgi:putative DNA primase/helicase
MNRHAPPKEKPLLGGEGLDKLTTRAEYHRTPFATRDDRKRNAEPILANANIENAVIGSLVAGGPALIDELGVAEVDPNLFYYSQSQVILGAIAELYDKGAPLDLQIVTEQLRKEGRLESVGGPAAITALGIDGNPAPEIVRYNLGELRSLYAKRETARIADRMQRGDIDPEDAKAELDAIIRCSQGNNSWRDALNESVVTSSELHGLHLTPRRKLLGDWFCEGDLGFIFAFRGVGKTWFALGMAQALSTGGKLGDWQAHKRVKVLYIDGEMPPDLMRDRCNGLQENNDRLEFLNHEILFERSEKVLNITNREVQQAITQRCVDTKVKVLFLDNLSTLATGMKENEADSWELVNPWLLELRRRRIAVVIVHHAGRSGEMRGTSKREDNVFWIIALDDMKKNADDKRGAQFVSRFTKPSRNTQEEVRAYEWHLVTDAATGLVSVGYRQAQTMDVFLGLIEDGVRDCNQIAQEMKTSPATVSRLAKRAIDAGKIIKKSREYFLTEGSKIDKKL